MTTPCPHCHKPIRPAALLGAIKSPAKAAAARINGKKGGKPGKWTECIEYQTPHPPVTPFAKAIHHTLKSSKTQAS